MKYIGALLALAGSQHTPEGTYDSYDEMTRLLDLLEDNGTIDSQHSE